MSLTVAKGQAPGPFLRLDHFWMCRGNHHRGLPLVGGPIGPSWQYQEGLWGLATGDLRRGARLGRLAIASASQIRLRKSQPLCCGTVTSPVWRAVIKYWRTCSSGTPAAMTSAKLRWPLSQLVTDSKSGLMSFALGWAIFMDCQV